MSPKQYEALKAELQELAQRGAVPSRPTREQRIDWAYGNAVVENPDVTIDMVIKAVDASRR